MSRRGRGRASRAERDGQDADGALGWLSDLIMTAFEYFWCSVGEMFGMLLYGLYRRLTWFNVIAFTLKYVPTGLYVYKTLKNVHTASRERIKKIQMKLDDLQLQIQIVDTKLCVREAEFLERTEELQRNIKHLRALRARVRELIDADDLLNQALHHAAETATNGDLLEGGDAANILADEEDCNFIMMLLKQLKNGEELSSAEMDKMDMFESAEDKEASLDSSEAESKTEYRVKVIKVTNVYRVASLKHFIKQKRMRRMNQQTILKKKIESIKKLLESWNKSLNAVLNNKTLQDPAVDLASQEAMGDYSKPNLREFSDSDSELKNSCNDMYYDEYNFNWAQNSYYNVDNDEHEQTDIFESSEYHHKQDLNYPQRQDMLPQHSPMCECSAGNGNVLFILPEETSSQVAIEDID
ncbi:hypothetical protein O0L34_g9745 [Tuta absoluta]|nr:hypothetical protein O0L34_g9745 [Tuta absoluta]